jgi:hypothetical protein
VENFWPTLPFFVPGSQGVPLWWDILWWVFQIVVMSFVLYIVTRWALKIDRLSNENVTTPSKKSDVPSDSPPLNM